MKVGELFAGVGGFGLGFERAGMEIVWQVEIDKFARRVLKKHWPDVERFKDVRECGRRNLAPVDVIIGGFPCQDVSIAGNRAGLAGERSGLWFEFLRIIKELRPEWAVVENVAGLLSSQGGRDFATILRGLVECGYGVAWRVLDAQYFGVPQRRRRVFVVGSLGCGRAAQVLFERESLPGYFTPRPKQGARVAPLVRAGAPVRRNGGSAPGGASADGEFVARPLSVHGRRMDGTAETFVATRPVVAFNASAGYTERQYPVRTGDYAQLGAATREAVAGTFGVRQLTPVECERLQGFPDGWTAGLSDSARYRALGNAVAVPVAAWIGKRIVSAGR